MLFVKGHIIVPLRTYTAATFCSDHLNLCVSEPSGCPGVSHAFTTVQWLLPSGFCPSPRSSIVCFKGAEWNLTYYLDDVVVEEKEPEREPHAGSAKTGRQVLWLWEFVQVVPNLYFIRLRLLYFPPMMHCSCNLTADYLSVCSASPLIEYLTSKQLRAITDRRMDSCPRTKAAASLWPSTCQSTCRLWTTASNCFSRPLVVSSILLNTPPWACSPVCLSYLTWTPYRPIKNPRFGQNQNRYICLTLKRWLISCKVLMQERHSRCHL